MDFVSGTPLGSIAEWILVAIRVLMGVIFLYFGIPKIRDLRKNAEDFERMGFKPGILFGTGIALLEVVGGIVLIVGLFPGLIAALFGIHMAVGTIWKITSTDKGFKDWSYDLLLLAGALIILAFGPGALVILGVY